MNLLITIKKINKKKILKKKLTHVSNLMGNLLLVKEHLADVGFTLSGFNTKLDYIIFIDSRLDTNH